MTPAVFFDRDGTVIEQVHYLNRVDQVQLLPGAAKTIDEIRSMGFKVVIVTNQAVIGKGLLTVEGLYDIQAEFDRQLKAEGTFVDAWYYCPEVRTAPDRVSIDHPDRKPGPGMLLRGAKEHNLDISESWMVGDMLSDTLAGRNAGCKATVLVQTGLADATDSQHSSVDHTVSDITLVPDLIRKAQQENKT